MTVVLNLIGLSLFLISLQAKAQQIVWEKYWPNVQGEFDAMVEGEGGNYFGVGNLTYIRNYAAPIKDTLSGCILVKINPDGDTVWFKKIGDYPEGKSFVFNNGNGTLTVIYFYIFWPVVQLRISIVSQETGQIFSQSLVNDFFYFSILKEVISDSFGNYYLVGEKQKAGTTNEYEMAYMKIDITGQISFFQGYSPGNHPMSAAQYMEPMPGGKMRMSGNKGKSIVAYELNSDGSVADYKEYIDNPYGYIQQDGAFVQQSDSGHFFVSAEKWSGPSGPNTNSFVRKVKANGDSLWHHNKGGSITKPSPTLSGGYLIVEPELDSSRFRNYDLNNQIVWSVNTMTGQIPGRKGTGKLLFLNDNSGVHYGRTVPNGVAYPFVMKIANVGYPVDPTNPVPPVVGVKEQKKNAGIGYAFPNPTTGIFHVLGMGSGVFRMVDAQGKTVIEAEHKGGDAIDVSALPCGVYTYTLVTKGSRTEGRVVRE